jgi:quinol monooxygenase YgiN
MIVVLGSVVAKDGKLEELLAISLQHVARSRLEPGCISHGVSRDGEDARRLVFVEQWGDRAALAAHFAVPASRAFVKSVLTLAAEPPSMAVYDATPLGADLSG